MSVCVCVFVVCGCVLVIQVTCYLTDPNLRDLRNYYIYMTLLTYWTKNPNKVKNTHQRTHCISVNDDTKKHQNTHIYTHIHTKNTGPHC